MIRLIIKTHKKEPNDDTPAGNLASSTDDIAEDAKSGSENLSFTGVWLSQVIDYTSIHEHIVSISVFEDITVEGDDVASMNSDTSHSTTNISSDVLLLFHTLVLIIENSQEQEENSDSTSTSGTSINIYHTIDLYLRCLASCTPMIPGIPRVRNLHHALEDDGEPH